MRNNGNVRFGRVLKCLMRQTGTTQAELAEHIGVTRQSVSSYLTGKTSPSMQGMGDIADFFGVSVDYLLGRTCARSNSDDIRTVCEYTGLSEKAVEKLVVRDNPNAEGISQMIESGCVIEVFEWMCEKDAIHMKQFKRTGSQ